MKNALISPNELIENNYRVAEVSETIFEVAKPLFWKECPDHIIADLFVYDATNETFLELKQPPFIATEEPKPLSISIL